VATIAVTPPPRRPPNHPNEDRRHDHIGGPQQNPERRPKPRDRQQPDLDHHRREREPNEPTLPRMSIKNVQRHVLFSPRWLTRTF